MASRTVDEILALPVDTLLDAVNTYLPGPLAPYLQQWEAAVRGVLPQDVLTYTDHFLTTQGSVHARKLPLMNPYHVLLVIVLYFAMVFGGLLLSRFLPKLELKLYSMVHNIFLVLLSGYMAVEVVHQAWRASYSLWGNGQDELSSGWPMAKIIWLFYVSKIAEFNDTLIMILKKNLHQVSFLHVYHHFSIFAIWWLVTFMAPGGEAYYSAALNSLVHVVMYGYYLCKSLGINAVDPIKYYITSFQMTQFVTMLMQATYNIATNNTRYPALTTQILFVYMITMLGLFYNFLQADKARKRAERKAAAANGNAANGKANGKAHATSATNGNGSASPSSKTKSKKDN